MPIHVAAAVVLNPQNEVLISLRPAHVHQGGLWEFPGGKVEQGEDVYTALQRELYEELGIHVQQARPLIRVHHDYGDKSVLLDVWLVQQFSGDVHGREGQAWRWVSKSDLRHYPFPAANVPIINAVHLPECYLITPSLNEDASRFLENLERCLVSGIQLVQLRAKELNETEFCALAEKVLVLCQRYSARLLLNAAPALVTDLGAHGVHLSSDRLWQCTHRPLAADLLVGASCHNARELAQAQRIQADFAVLAPVLTTASHPNTSTLGWEQFHVLTDEVALPVYALGGVTREHLDQAFECGAQGIAAIRGIWNAC